MSAEEPSEPGDAETSAPEETQEPSVHQAIGTAAINAEPAERNIRAELNGMRDSLPIDLHRAAHQLSRLSPILQKRKLAVVPGPMERQLHNQRLFQQRRLAGKDGNVVRASEEERTDSLARAAAFLADPDLVRDYLGIHSSGASRAERDFIYFFQEAYGDPEELAYVCDLIRSTTDKGRIATGRYREVHGPDGRYMGHI